MGSFGKARYMCSKGIRDMRGVKKRYKIKARYMYNTSGRGCKMV